MVCTLLASAATKSVADPPPFNVAVMITSVRPKIDGTLDDPVWLKGTHVTLDWDIQFQRTASEKTDAYILADDKNIYVAIVARQSEPITATLHTNDVTLAADDLVRVYLWPGGNQGFEYGFVSTPIGTHNEFSTENTAYAPSWTSVGKIDKFGYTITMQIPFDIMRGDGRSTWRLQVERVVHLNGQDFEWAHNPAQTAVDSAPFLGYLTGMPTNRAMVRSKPRLGLYGLGQIASQGSGGSTSRMGADIAIPITQTSSFFGTLHPDYSNVDIDQQTIAPTAFTRQFSEVRPFFTQGGNAYNTLNCDDCLDFPFLYTPNIPTPRDGYAVEGVQGPATFAAFDALGSFGRTDNAESMVLHTQDNRDQFDVLHFGTDCESDLNCPFLAPNFTSPFVDNTTIYQLTVGNGHNANAYVTDGAERGSSVADPRDANFSDFAVNLYNATSGIFPSYHSLGSEYAPVDQFVEVTDASGPAVFFDKTFNFAPTSQILNVSFGQDIERYWNHLGQLDLADAETSLTVNTKSQFRLGLSTGYQYLLSGSYGSTINQNGVQLSYAPTTNAPTIVSYNIGRFGPGYLRSTTRLTTFRLGPRGTIAFEADNSNQILDSGLKQIQWLDRASVAYQLSSTASIAIGVRKITGTSPFAAPPPATSCSALFVSPGCFVDSSNVSFAYHRSVGQDEVYVVYGDPNRLSTFPAFIVKYVHYFGAQKGT
jgi:hypothetical protein